MVVFDATRVERFVDSSEYSDGVDLDVAEALDVKLASGMLSRRVVLFRTDRGPFAARLGEHLQLETLPANRVQSFPLFVRELADRSRLLGFVVRDREFAFVIDLEALAREWSPPQRDEVERMTG